MEFATRKEAVDAIEAMNGQKFKGRPLTVELSVSKANYEKRVSNIMEHNSMEKKDVIKPKSIKVEERKKKKDDEKKKQEEEEIEKNKTKTQQRKE